MRLILLLLLVVQTPRIGTRVPVVGSPPGSTPTITSFTPTSGPVLTTVTVSGIQLTGASAVTVNGTSASFTVVSATTVTVTVPVAATTGAIAITTSDGTATSGTNFTVTPTYYVATTGSDAVSCATARAIGTPKLTISNAVACLSAGDTLYIRAGTYTGDTNVINSQNYTVPSGTLWTNAVTIAGYPGETVTLRPTNIGGIGLTTGAPHYLIFQDFAIDMSNEADNIDGSVEAIYLSNGAHHVRFQRLDVAHTMGHLIQLSDNNTAGPPQSMYAEFLQCKLHDSGNSTGDSGHGGAGINNGYLLYNKTADNLFDGNDWYDSKGIGLNIYSNNNIVRNNTIHGNGTRGGTNFGINIGSSAYPSGSNSNLIYNNLIYGNRGGIQVYTYSTSTGVYNNTIYNNTPDAGIRMEFYGSAPVLKNNIVYSNGSAIVDAGGTGTPVQSNNFTTDPTFVNAATFDFHLQASSGAIDAGTSLSSTFTIDKDGVNRPVGAAWDIGAYER